MLLSWYTVNYRSGYISEIRRLGPNYGYRTVQAASARAWTANYDIGLRGGLAHWETGKVPGGPLPITKILKLQISANSFDTKRVTWQCKCFRCYVIPPVGSNKAPTLAALVADYRRLPQRCSWCIRVLTDSRAGLSERMKYDRRRQAAAGKCWVWRYF